MTIALENALTKRLTSLQEAFVAEVASGADPIVAAERAGYQNESARINAWRMMREPAILAAIQIGMARELAISAPIALRVLREFVADETCDKRIRLASAKTLLDRAGVIPPKAIDASKAGEKPLNDMSTTELRALADKLEGELADRAKPVSSASVAPVTTQAIEDII